MIPVQTLRKDIVNVPINLCKLSPVSDFSRIQERTISITQRDGCPWSADSVTIQQTKHKFLFGCATFELSALANDELTGEERAQAKSHERRLYEIFNFATLPFYWGRFEPEEGKPDTTAILRTAKRLKKHGLEVKGHPLCWHTVSADWLMRYSNSEIMDRQLARIRRDVTDFKGVIDCWDVVNEAVIMPVFNKYDNAITRICWERGRVALIRETFSAARETNPNATLLLNDFDMSTAYECLIEAVLEAGVKIDALGLQSHMHQGWWGIEKLLDVVRRFERFGIPLHFTEATLLIGDLMPSHIEDLNDWQVDHWPTTPEGEARQAAEVTQLYTTLFNHPSVHALTWWGANDGGWLGAPSGLLRKDDSEKPAYQALQKLIKQDWWLAPTQLKLDEKGSGRIRGAPGEYEALVGHHRLSFSVGDGVDQVTVSLP